MKLLILLKWLADNNFPKDMISLIRDVELSSIYIKFEGLGNKHFLNLDEDTMAWLKLTAKIFYRYE